MKIRRSHTELMDRVQKFGSEVDANTFIAREFLLTKRYKVANLIVKALGGGIPILGAILQAGAIWAA
jgi:hypothetical protein